MVFFKMLGSSASKESACNAGDVDSILRSERSPREGNGNPLQYSHWRIPWIEEPDGLQSAGSQRVRHGWAIKQQSQSMYRFVPGFLHLVSCFWVAHAVYGVSGSFLLLAVGYFAVWICRKWFIHFTAGRRGCFQFGGTEDSAAISIYVHGFCTPLGTFLLGTKHMLVSYCTRHLQAVVKWKSLSRVQLFVTPWTVAHQAPLSMEFSRQEYWSG